jgi:hypothetical protein
MVVMGGVYVASFIRLTGAIVQRDIAARASAARLAEYVKLKDEIASRSSLQSAIMTLDIAAVGTLGGFVLGRQADSLLLLLLIPLSAAMELWWLDHARSIDRIGSYIRVHLWPRIIEWERVPGRPESYEEIVQESRLSIFDRSVLMLPFFVVFIGPSLASIIVSAQSLTEVIAWILWGIDLALFLFALALWIGYLVSASRAMRRSAGAPTDSARERLLPEAMGQVG